MKKIQDDLADFTTDRRVLLLSAFAILVGLAAAGAAYVLLWLISLFTNLAFFGRWSATTATPASAHLGLWVLLIPTVGGLLIGLMARFGSEKIRGHGIPEALEAILIGRSKMQGKVALLKPLSSAISIGTGGPFGAEGPIIMTGGAIGSLLAQGFHLSSAERKTLLVAGAAAGMAAVFCTPVAAALLAVELLLFEWKPRSFIPVACAAATAAAVRVPLLGQGPIFGTAPHLQLRAATLLWALVIGVLAGLCSGILTTMVYAAEDLFERLPIHWMWWPALGGLLVGIGGYLEPRVLGVGYELIHALLRGDLLGPAVLALLIGKAVVWCLALGSGTSGGVLAPLLMMGGALGAIAAGFIPVGNAGLWAIIGMASMMAGTMRSPLTAMVFTLELTHDLNVLPALLIGCVAAQAVTVLLMKRSILTEKVARRGHHLTREYAVDPFEVHRVQEVMVRSFKTVPANKPVKGLSDSLPRLFVGAQGAPVVDAEGRLAGILTQGDVMRALERHDSDAMTALDAGTSDPVVAYPDELLRDAVVRMLQNDIGRLPVVDRQDPTRLVGYMERRQLMKARLRWYEEEHIREGRWKLESARA